MASSRQVREMRKEEMSKVVDYFRSSSTEFLRAMGVDPQKMPPRDEWELMLTEDLERPFTKRKFYFVTWILDGLPIGHSNINVINFGHDAFMHLHMWHQSPRGKGHGTAFVEESIDVFFREFELKSLYCQPYALNPGPNKIAQKLGFELEKTFETVPGYLNFQQEVNLWRLDRETWLRRRQQKEQTP